MIDSFSRKMAARATKSLKSRDVNKAIKELVNELKPQRLRFDLGKDYNNKVVLSTLRDKNINYTIANPPYKSSIAERGGKTLKDMLYKAMQHKGDVHWPKYLNKVIKAYNSRTHRMLGMSPNEAHKPKNIDTLWFKFRNQAWKNMPPPANYKYEVNDAVRISEAAASEPLRKDFYQSFSTAIYYISARFSKANVNRYTLKDQQNDPVNNRTFTEQQMHLVKVSKQTVYRIERVLHYKVFQGRVYAYVKWLNYPKKFNTYVPKDDVINLQSQD